MCERGKMGTLATYVVVELDVGILNESEEVGKLFVCFSSCQSFCAEAWGEEGRVGKIYTLLVCPARTSLRAFVA
jgi:hypothetical protein